MTGSNIPRQKTIIVGTHWCCVIPHIRIQSKAKEEVSILHKLLMKVGYQPENARGLRISKMSIAMVHTLQLKCSNEPSPWLAWVNRFLNTSVKVWGWIPLSVKRDLITYEGILEVIELIQHLKSQAEKCSISDQDVENGSCSESSFPDTPNLLRQRQDSIPWYECL